jgi:hypothetical protein
LFGGAIAILPISSLTGEAANLGPASIPPCFKCQRWNDQLQNTCEWGAYVDDGKALLEDQADEQSGAAASNDESNIEEQAVSEERSETKEMTASDDESNTEEQAVSEERSLTEEMTASDEENDSEATAISGQPSETEETAASTIGGAVDENRFDNEASLADDPGGPAGWMDEDVASHDDSTAPAYTDPAPGQDWPPSQAESFPGMHAYEFGVEREPAAETEDKSVDDANQPRDMSEQADRDQMDASARSTFPDAMPEEPFDERHGPLSANEGWQGEPGKFAERVNGDPADSDTDVCEGCHIQPYGSGVDASGESALRVSAMSGNPATEPSASKFDSDAANAEMGHGSDCPNAVPESSGNPDSPAWDGKAGMTLDEVYHDLGRMEVTGLDEETPSGAVSSRQPLRGGEHFAGLLGNRVAAIERAGWKVLSSMAGDYVANLQGTVHRLTAVCPHLDLGGLWDYRQPASAAREGDLSDPSFER